MIAPACPRLRAFFLKFSRIAPGLQSDAETDGLHAARLFYAHNEKARGHGARRSGVLRVLSEPGGLRVPQQQTDAGWRTGAKCGDISRETAIAPAQWKAKAAACEWFICAEPEVSNGADNGVCELRVKPPCKLPPRLELQRFCKRFAAPFYSLAGKVSNKDCAKNGQMSDALYQTLWRDTQ